MFEFITKNLLWTQGFYIVSVLLIIAALGFFLFRPLLYFAVALLIFSFYFFRNPDRVCLEALTDDTVLVCPADGKIVDIQYDSDNGFEGYAQKVSIFLSPFDVHVNWIPCDGTIEDVVYRPGTFALAFLPKSSELNERNDLRIGIKNDKIIVVRQIAGMVARRICCWVNAGQQVKSGEKYGMIRFGSRVDILMPKNIELSVATGQRVYGGQTVLGRWKWHLV